MKETRELPKKVIKTINNYIKLLSIGEEFTIDDVCEATGYFDKNHLDSHLCGFGFRTSIIERNGNYFIKKGYYDSELKSLVKNTINKYGFIQLDTFVEDLSDAEKSKIEKIIDKGCTDEGWIIKNSNGMPVIYK